MILSVNDLSFSYRCKKVLENVSFDVEKGEFLSVLGPNGVGKSTLFRCILGILTEYTGSISVCGTDIKEMSPRALARHVAYIPQVHRPTFGYTVLDTVLMGTTRQISAFAQPRKEQIEQAKTAMERIGIADYAGRNFAQLSGGEQQLVLVARAIAQQADILIMDEPTSALDYGNQMRVLGLIRDLSREGYTALLSTHNPQHALSFADRVMALCDGEIAALGSPDKVMTAGLMKKLYRVNVSFAQTPAGSVIVPEYCGGEVI